MNLRMGIALVCMGFGEIISTRDVILSAVCIFSYFQTKHFGYWLDTRCYCTVSRNIQDVTLVLTFCIYGFMAQGKTEKTVNLWWETNQENAVRLTVGLLIVAKNKLRQQCKLSKRCSYCWCEAVCFFTDVWVTFVMQYIWIALPLGNWCNLCMNDVLPGILTKWTRHNGIVKIGLNIFHLSQDMIKGSGRTKSYV